MIHKNTTNKSYNHLRIAKDPYEKALERIVERFNGIAKEDLNSQDLRILEIAFEALGENNPHVIKVKQYWQKETEARNIFYV